MKYFETFDVLYPPETRKEFTLDEEDMKNFNDFLVEIVDCCNRNAMIAAQEASKIFTNL